MRYRIEHGFLVRPSGVVVSGNAIVIRTLRGVGYSLRGSAYLCDPYQ
jgi:hypothetical protein